MSNVAPFRIVCRSTPVRLQKDASRRVQQRVFSCGIQWSYPRIPPVRSATTRFRSLASNQRGASAAELVKEQAIDSLQAATGGSLKLRYAQRTRTSWNTSQQVSSLSATPIVKKETDLQESRGLVADETKPSANHSQEPSLPWYLHAQHAITRPAAPEHLLERQKMPEQPDDSPELLDPLLKYVSMDLGIDYLTLLDLRSLDPPAALGTNLIMVIGTARGEKHLHVSADRLCRWLRSNYKLNPHADGLLGRGEFKIKMRRRNKRLKILAHVGSVDSRPFDDGLSTGWVCVTFTDTSLPSNTVQSSRHANTNFIGFGESSASTTVVLHMLTEGKREELNLEKLWSNRLEKRRLGAAQEDVRFNGYDEAFSNQQGTLIG